MNDFSEFGKAEHYGWSEANTAKAYATGFASAAEHCVPTMVAASGAGKGMRALDVCCGHGIVAEGLLNAGATATGLDFSEAMIELARQRVPAAEFLHGDATSLPFEDASFDLVTMAFGILHIPDSEAAISEARRVLKPGGKFVYSVWQGPEDSPAFRIVFGSIQEHGDPGIVMPPAPPIHAYADPDHAFPILQSRGFAKPQLDVAPCVWRIDEPGRPYDYFYEGTVRGALLLRSQPEKHAEAIRNAISHKVRSEFGADGPWVVPIPAAVVSAEAV